MIDPPPWHYGGDVLHLAFRATRRGCASSCHHRFCGTDPEEGVLWFTEWVSASEANPELSFVNPERSQYKECIVMVSCQFQGSPGTMSPIYGWTTILRW
jgi:hypothetical protein